MIGYLRIRGIALLDDVALELGPGLNVLTGETGAGKSIVVEALTLLRGVRRRVDLVRAGNDAAVVDAAFELRGGAVDRVKQVLARHRLELVDDVESLVLQRVVPRTGRGRASVQLELVPGSVLAEIGAELLDVCSQHEHHSLTHPERHGQLLDAYAGLGDELELYTLAYRGFREASNELERVRLVAVEGVRRAEYLRYQIDELSRVDPRVGEFEELRQRIDWLRDARHWLALAADATQILDDADDSVRDRLATLGARARQGAARSPLLGELSNQLELAAIACAEAAQLSERFAERLDLAPGELESCEERLFALESVRRKHGVEADELPARLDSLRAELEGIERVDEELALLQQRVREAHAEARGLAERLFERRQAHAGRLSKALCRELAGLHMRAARLEARVTLEEEGRLGPRGADSVEFLFSANAGEALQPLNRVASGGELSRVLLALKSVLGAGESVSTYVFDEVDAGVGGAVAEAIGRRLAQTSRAHQVLCVTHLPQIAAFADRHFRVTKRLVKGRTLTQVERLDEGASLEEVARMLGGARVTDSAREHAAELRAEARRGQLVPGPVGARVRRKRVRARVA